MQTGIRPLAKGPCVGQDVGMLDYKGIQDLKARTAGAGQQPVLRGVPRQLVRDRLREIAGEDRPCTNGLSESVAVSSIPPGCSTREASAKAASRSPIWCTTSTEKARSKLRSGKGQRFCARQSQPKGGPGPRPCDSIPPEGSTPQPRQPVSSISARKWFAVPHPISSARPAASPHIGSASSARSTPLCTPRCRLVDGSVGD